MSSRRNRNREFEMELTDQEAPEWSDPADAEAMRELHVASENVLRLATQTYNAAATGNDAAAQAARESLETELGLTTRLIDELLSGGAGQHTMH